MVTLVRTEIHLLEDPEGYSDGIKEYSSLRNGSFILTSSITIALGQ